MSKKYPVEENLEEEDPFDIEKALKEIEKAKKKKLDKKKKVCIGHKFGGDTGIDADWDGQVYQDGEREPTDI